MLPGGGQRLNNFQQERFHSGGGFRKLRVQLHLSRAVDALGTYVVGAVDQRGGAGNIEGNIAQVGYGMTQLDVAFDIRHYPSRIVTVIAELVVFVLHLGGFAASASAQYVDVFLRVRTGIATVGNPEIA